MFVICRNVERWVGTDNEMRKTEVGLSLKVTEEERRRRWWKSMDENRGHFFPLLALLSQRSAWIGTILALAGSPSGQRPAGHKMLDDFGFL